MRPSDDTWAELAVDRVPRQLVEPLCGALWAAGVAGIEERDPPDLALPPLQPWDAPAERPELPFADVRASLPVAVTDDAVAAVLRVWPDADPQIRPIAIVDWEAASQDAFPRLVVSPHLAVAAPWNAQPGDVVIDPGVGFGTGHHPTTAAILAVLARRLAAQPGAPDVLDVGCGSGILALAAARLGAHARGVDIDADAVEQAGRNAALSGLEVPFSTTPVGAIDAPADVVLANLHAEVLVALADELVRLTRGTLVVAGVLDDREPAVRSALDARLLLAERHVETPWICLVYEAAR